LISAKQSAAIRKYDGYWLDIGRPDDYIQATNVFKNTRLIQTKRYQGMNWKVPFFDLVLGDEEKQVVLNVMESNWLTAGPKIAEFEVAFATVSDGEVHAVAVSSTTAALYLSLLALGIGPGDEVIVSSLTFVAVDLPVL